MALVLVACSSGDPPELSSQESGIAATFQHGVGGYTGLVDGHITSAGGGNGGRDFTGTNALVVNNTTGGYETAGIIKFGNLSLPAGATVTSASVTLVFEDFSGGNSLKAYYLLPAWNSTVVGWQNRDTSTP